MKKILFRVVFLMMVLVMSSKAVWACDCEQAVDVFSFVPCEKMYIKTGQLGLLDKSIFVTAGGFWIETSALYSDINGIFIVDYKKNVNTCEEYEWKCSACGRCNLKAQGRCPCGKGIYCNK